MTMKRYSKLFIALCAVALCGCQQAELSDQVESNSSGQLIKVVTNLNPVSSKASDTINFDTSNSFYLLVDQAGSSFDYFVQMRYDGGEWSSYELDGQTLCPMNLVDVVSEISVSALYSGEKSLTKEQFMSKTEYAVAGEDMLYAKSGVGATVISSEGVISLEFDHLLSQLNVSVETFVDGLGAIESVTLAGLQDSIEWNASTSSAPTSYGDVVSIVSEGSASSHSFILAPQSVDGFTLTVLFDSGESYISRYSSSLTLASGEAYSLTVNIGEETPRDQVVVTSIEGGSWSAGGDYTLDIE